MPVAAPRVAWLVVLVGCYHVPSDLSCKITCDETCPSGLTCVDGYCTSGDACDCGGLDKACCSGVAACAAGGYCSAGTCRSCVADIALGRFHTCIVEHDGTVWCAGDNANMQLGIAAAASDTFVQVGDATGPITDATAIAAGKTHSCAVRGGHVWCWGGNGEGELGDGTGNNSTVAVEVVNDTEPLADIVEIGLGTQFSCARSSAGGVSCWGRNDLGQLGDNTFTVRLHAAPVLVNGLPLTGATALAVGDAHACVIANGQPWCWGANGFGQVGDGTMNNAGQPVMFGSASVTAIAPGRYHTCALLAGGTVECAGDSYMNRLGDGKPMTSESTPVAVLVAAGGAPFGGATAIAAGGVSCTVDSDGGVACWGNSTHGQSGNGGTAFPLPVALPVAADRVVAHWAHACAHGLDGSWWCWGRDSESEFGDGVHLNVTTPALLAVSCD